MYTSKFKIKNPVCKCRPKKVKNKNRRRKTAVKKGESSDTPFY